MSVKIVLGAAYGDEGKGLMVDYFSRHLKDCIVVRFNGGSQAGHTVVTDKIRHEFHHFGSGTFVNCPTFLGSDFILNPIMFNREYQTLKSYNPKVIVHNNCIITTPVDMLLNQLIDKKLNHGSCGLGINETILRHKILPLTLENYKTFNYADLNQYALDRLRKLNIEPSDKLSIDICKYFTNEIETMLLYCRKHNGYEILRDFDNIIFEGAQGLLLSERYGKMPHCTPSETGSVTTIEICKELNLENIEICYVTRAYTTRHGAGELEGETTKDEMGLKIKDETNVDNVFQGKFRYAPLSVNLIADAINKDFSAAVERLKPSAIKKSIAVTCLDQISQESHGRIIESLDIKCGHVEYKSYGNTHQNVFKTI